jgi:CDP-diacylglycerol---serine O-phosphatidyltransferase
LARRRVSIERLSRLRQRFSRVPSSVLGLLPSSLTVGNALCGFAALAAASGTLGGSPLGTLLGLDALTTAAVFIYLGMLFDMLDGPVAKALRRTSDFGAELDSLADVVTFGVAPAFLLLRFADEMLLPLQAFTTLPVDLLCWLAALVYLAGTALRLARFNVQRGVGGTTHFTGLPSPGGALVAVASISLCHLLLSTQMSSLGTSPGFLLAPVAVFAAGFLMVSHFPYRRLVSKVARGGSLVVTVLQVLLVLGGVLASLVWAPAKIALALGALLYAVSGPVRWFLVRYMHRSSQPDLGAAAVPQAQV